MRYSIRRKVLAAIMAVTILTACSITLVFYFKAADMIENSYTENLSGRVGQAVLALDNALKEIYYINIKAASDESLALLAEEYQASERGETLDNIAELLRQYKAGCSHLNALHFIMPKERLAVTSEDYPMCKRNLPEDKLGELIEMQGRESSFFLSEDLVHEGEKRLLCIQPVWDSAGETVGYLCANTEERALFYEFLKPVYDEKTSGAWITDKNRRIVTSREYGEMGSLFEEKEDAAEAEIRISHKGIFSGCSMYLSVEKKEVLREFRQMQLFLGLICLLVLVPAAGLAVWIAGTICRPIRSITNTAQKVGAGELSLRAEIATRDEIGILCGEFNNMLDQIEALIQQVIQQERLKKDAELEALQYQITPHFMYNTLNSMKYAALMKGEKELGGLMGDFVELLQASIQKKGTFLTVADELHILENYVNLQEFRYHGSFQVAYEIQKEAMECYVPRLLLQPLVENALLHGLDMKSKEGKLLIRGKVEDNRLVLSVSDNGRGMSREQMQELLLGKAKKSGGLFAIGIANVKERLELYYGKEGGIVYESDSSGTTASVFLPAAKEPEQEKR